MNLAKQKIFVVLSALLILSVSLGGCVKELFITEETTAETTTAVNNTAEESSYEPTCYGYDSLVSDEEREIYRLIGEHIESLTPERFRVKSDVDVIRMNEIVDLYCLDYPEIFWVDSAIKLDFEVSPLGIYYLTLRYTIQGDALAEAQRQLETVVKEITDSFPQDSSLFDKEVAINDYLVENCTYDVESLEIEEGYVKAYEHTAYGALVDKKAVCDGYSKAFSLLCNQAGINSVILFGYTSEEDSPETYEDIALHSWNAVKLDDGEWYQIDTTWNASHEETIPHLGRYLDFNLTSVQSEMRRYLLPLFGDEDISDNPLYSYVGIFNTFIPECTAVQYNYFVRNCVTLEDIDNCTELVKALAESAKNESEYFCFLVDDGLELEDVYNEFINSKAAQIIKSANRTNRHSTKLSSETYLYSDEVNRIILIKLDYV